MKKKVIICFPINGGVRQFTDELYNRVSNQYIYDILGGKKKNRLKILKYLFFKEIIFSNNNILIYLLLPFFFGKITLILHDHKIRKGAHFRERLILNLFKFFKFRFSKIIIHSNTDDDAINLLKKKNIFYLKMPPHGMPEIEPNHNNIPIYNLPIRILCFGRIEEYKNFDYIAELVSTNSSFILTIAGAGEISKNLKKLTKNNNNIEIINKYITDNELTKLMREHHYLALPYNDITQTGLIDMAGFFKKPLLLSNLTEFNKLKYFNFCNYITLNNIELAQKEINNLTTITNDDYIKKCSYSEINYNISLGLWDNYIELVTKIK